MIQYCSNTRCFVVGVGKTGSVNEAFEWRISTSFAERCLMFNLNSTQIRCYV
jgi:D-arabinose 5-phosphate isomerase GutQ